MAKSRFKEEMGVGSRQKAIGEGSSDLLLLHTIPCTDHLDDLIMEGGGRAERSREGGR